MKASVILVVAGLAVAKCTSMRYTEQMPANYLTFVNDTFHLHNLECSLISYMVSEGEAYGGTVCGTDSLLVRAGRNKTTPVADHFKSGLSAGNMMVSFCFSGGDVEPEQLNFYIEADFTFKLGSQAQNMGTYRLRIGQGHGGGFVHNNWWIAGAECSKVGDGIICSSNQGGQHVTFSGSNQDHVSVYFH